MKESINKLLDAQDIDLDIDKLHKAKKEYPDEIESLKSGISSIEQRIVDAENRLKEIEVSRRTIEDEIKAERDTIETKNKRLLETKTNKEYNAVHNEIELARERIDNLETQELELMNEEDTLKPKKTELEESLDSIKDDNTALIKDLEQKLNSVEDDIAALESRREQVLEDVDDRTTRVYKRLRQGKDGIAIAKLDVDRHACTGCYKKLPPQKVLELFRSDKLIFCESCGRILAIDKRGEE